LELYWTQIDPTDDGGQFNDRGFVYSPAIFYTSEEEKTIAEESKRNLQNS
jgi:peptide-methionine (S)-S-oxide reductase